MLSHEGIDTNLCFLILEVRKQLQKTRMYLETPSAELIETILTRDDYVDNLRSIIQRKCFAKAATFENIEDPQVHVLKAMDVISSNLERIADFCEDIVDQARYVEQAEVLEQQDFEPYFDEVIEGLDRIDKALFDRNVQVALQVCRAEHKLDRLYERSLRETVEELKKGVNTHGLVTVVFICHYFERMGDALLNIGEAVISACLGERIKISRFWALDDSLPDVQLGANDPIALQPMAETRSGSRISRVKDETTEGGRAIIFKEGRLSKLREERANIERWHEIMPGLAPKIHSFHENGESGATLFEYLPGQTFEELLLVGQSDEIKVALDHICRTLTAVWQSTHRSEPASAKFARQLASRLPDVFAVHPDFAQAGQTIGTVPARSLKDLLADAAHLDEELLSPFSVFIHGDLNVDNIIFDADREEVHFIDLHRSKQTDYLQDVSVFLVSNYRLQALENPVRSRLNYTMKTFLEFARGYARKMDDSTFEARLCLGVARSMATSTRFVLARKMAKSMFLRARYLVEQLVHCDPARYSDFVIPEEVLLD